jgi:transposase
VDPEILLSVKDKEGWVFNDSGTFAIKSFIRRHKLTKDVIATEKVICFWSEAYALRESYRRGDLLEAVEELLAHPWRYEAANNYGRKRYIKETYVTDAGEAAKKIISFNKDRFKDDAELDGFYCILTSETKMRDDEIVKHYRGLIRIEESFRVIKSDLEGRPVFVWSRPHINAHFLICFIALVIMRILQDRVGYTISPTALKEALATARCTPLEKSIYVIDETTDAYKQLETSLSVSLSNRYAPVEVIKAYRKQIIANVKDHNVFKS